jgi:hypothetical protein
VPPASGAGPIASPPVTGVPAAAQGQAPQAAPVCPPCDCDKE